MPQSRELRPGQFKNSVTKNPILMPTFSYFEQIAVWSLWDCFCGKQGKAHSASVWLGCVDQVEEEDARENDVRVEKEL